MALISKSTYNSSALSKLSGVNKYEDNSAEEILDAYLKDLKSGVAQKMGATLADYVSSNYNGGILISNAGSAKYLSPITNYIKDELQPLVEQKVSEQEKGIVDKYGKTFASQNFVNPLEQGTGLVGEGANANRQAGLTKLTQDITSRLNAVDRASQAAQKYESTGKFEGYPDFQDEIDKYINSLGGGLDRYVNNPNLSTANMDAQTRAKVERLRALKSGEDWQPSEEAKAVANAAAARVGASLPYPGTAIDKGELSRGTPGIVTNEMSPEQFYDESGNFKKDVFDEYNKLQKQGGKGYNEGTVADTSGTSFTNDYLNSLTSQDANASGFAQTGDVAAKKLVADMLKGGNLVNLTQNPAWNSQPEEVRKQAFDMLNGLFDSPQALGQFVNEAGIENLNNYDWWNKYPDKQQAWNHIQQLQQSGQQAGSLYSQTGTAGTGTTIQQDGATTGADGSMTGGSADDYLSIIQNSNLPDGVKALFSEIAQGWDPSKEINAQNIIDEFNNIKATTIDPYFQEQADIFIDDVKRTQAYSNQQRDLGLQQEQMQGQQAFEDTQKNLEARGMTFSGEANELLGNASAYDPTQKQYYQFGQAGEGKVQAQNRLMSSSSQAQYQKNLADLQRQTEQTLGTAGAQTLFPNIKGIQTQAGSVTGSLAQQKNQAEASTLSDLYGQAQQNYSDNKNINVFK